MRVEEAPRYGQPLSFPKEVQRKQAAIVLSAMRRQYGPLGLLPFIFRVWREQRRIRRGYPDLVAEAGIFQSVAVHSMPAIYQIDELAACDGDPFDNFKKFNVAMFEAMDEQGTWKIDSVTDERDRLRIKVSTCANVDLFRKLPWSVRYT